MKSEHRELRNIIAREMFIHHPSAPAESSFRSANTFIAELERREAEEQKAEEPKPNPDVTAPPLHSFHEGYHPKGEGELPTDSLLEQWRFKDAEGESWVSGAIFMRSKAEPIIAELRAELEHLGEVNKMLNERWAKAESEVERLKAEREEETEKLRVTWFAGGRWVETHHQFSSDTQTQEEGFVAFLKGLKQEKP